MKITQQKEPNLLATRIRQARRNAHISQKELGERIGVSDKSISSYEKERSIPPFEKLKHIATVTHKPIAYFTQEKVEVNATEVLNKITRIEKVVEEIKRVFLDNAPEGQLK